MTAATGTSRPLRLGVDVGGTFTDVVLVDGASGSISAGKTLTTPDDLATGVLSGVDKALAAGGAAIGGVDYIVHG
ncbi:MAG: hydantoinase/oxoprolinase N-terminal domain-containing protein, partial [Anaerolineae bacterium]